MEGHFFQLREFIWMVIARHGQDGRHVTDIDVEGRVGGPGEEAVDGLRVGAGIGQVHSGQHGADGGLHTRHFGRGVDVPAHRLGVAEIRGLRYRVGREDD